MNTIILVYLILFVAPISNFIHELGHMFGAKLAKAEEITLYLGRGKKIYRLVFKNIEIHINLFIFTSGLTVSKRMEAYRSHEIIYITFLGPFFNAIIVFISYLLFKSISGPFILMIFLYNSWLFVMNIIPFKIGNQKSDGYIIVREFFRNDLYK